MNFETKTAVNRLAAKPQNNTTAKPLTDRSRKEQKQDGNIVAAYVNSNNRGERFVESIVHRRNNILATPQFFPNSLKVSTLNRPPCQWTARRRNPGSVAWRNMTIAAM